MANEIKKIITGQPFSENQFMREKEDRIDENDPAQDERRSFRANEEGYLDSEFGGNILPIEYIKISNTETKQIFPDGSFKTVLKVNINTFEIYDEEGVLENTITNDNGNVTQTLN